MEKLPCVADSVKSDVLLTSDEFELDDVREMIGIVVKHPLYGKMIVKNDVITEHQRSQEDNVGFN